MTDTLQDLETFYEFARRKLQNGGFPSLEACLQLWRQAVEEEDVVKAVMEAEADVAAGRVYTREQVEEYIRENLKRTSNS